LGYYLYFCPAIFLQGTKNKKMENKIFKTLRVVNTLLIVVVVCFIFTLLAFAMMPSQAETAAAGTGTNVVADPAPAAHFQQKRQKVKKFSQTTVRLPCFNRRSCSGFRIERNRIT
jgi:biotin transporter BioY